MKAKTIIKRTVAFLVVVGISFGVGYHVRGITENNETVVVESSNETPDLKMPTEIEKETVKKEEVYSMLVEVSEFSTYSGEYNVTKAADFSRYLLSDEKSNKDGIKIPGTTNSIEISCNGTVKVGYDFNDIVIKVDNDSQKIYISLPPVKINDNYINWDSVKCEENNCILNPIDFEQYHQMISEIKDLGLKDVESKGIYTSAEESVKKLINTTLAGFEEFEVIYL